MVDWNLLCVSFSSVMPQTAPLCYLFIASLALHHPTNTATTELFIFLAVIILADLLLH